MISEHAFQGDARNVYSWRHISSEMPYRLAAERLLETAGTVLLLTGFYIDEFNAIETDGLSGTLVLAHVLTKLGLNPVIVTDDTTKHAFSHLFSRFQQLNFPITDTASSHRYSQQVLTDLSPVAVIGIERPGPNTANKFVNWNGRDITSHTARMETLITRAPLSIGIGDGGNELGMGTLTADQTFRTDRDQSVLCSVPAHITLLGSCSDYAAYALATALAVHAETNCLPEPDVIDNFLTSTGDLGIVDGMTGRYDGGVDGKTKKEVLNRYRVFRSMTAPLITYRQMFSMYQRELREQYGVAVCPVTAQWDPIASELILGGAVLLPTHRAKLLQKLNDCYLNVRDNTLTLSDPMETSSLTPWFPIAEPINLFDRPDGRLTTQAIGTDMWGRILATDSGWSLVQTPDYAMGWTSNVLPSTCVPHGDAPNKWTAFKYAESGKLVTAELSLDTLHKVAESYLGLPYLWGGRTAAGIDCSGLTQAIYRYENVMLPRNSRDQRRCGQRVSMTHSEPGDLIFAVGREKSIHHVGIRLNETTIEHACLALGRVVRESLDAFAEKYRIIAVRRMALFA